MKIVDTTGMKCPAPLIATKKAIREADENELVRIILDNRTSFENVSRFLKDTGAAFSSQVSDGSWTIETGRAGAEHNREYAIPSEAAIPHFKKGDFIIAFTSDTMGQGDEELGKLLIENFIKAVKDLDTLPRKMVFYNRGVFLGSTGSPVVDHLRELEMMGVVMLLCATCVNHYSLGEKIKVGTLSNMFEIAGEMESASKVIRP
jgi:selenium metabolism protein YedF